MRHALDLRDWLRRWGFKDSGDTEFPVLPSIQPVVEVADVSNLIPQVLPAVGWLGGTIAGAGAGAHAAFTVSVVAPGGAYLRVIGVGVSNATSVFFRPAASSALTLAAVVTATPRPMSGTLTTTLKLGTAANPFGTGDSRIRVSSNSTDYISDAFYLPNGWSVDFLSENNTNTLYASVLVQEVQGQLPPDA